MPHDRTLMPTLMPMDSGHAGDGTSTVTDGTSTVTVTPMVPQAPVARWSAARASEAKTLLAARGIVVSRVSSKDEIRPTYTFKLLFREGQNSTNLRPEIVLPEVHISFNVCRHQANC